MSKVDFGNPFGVFVSIPGHYTFVPRIVLPKINYTTSLIDMMTKTKRVLGELKALMDVLPTHYRLYPIRMIREALIVMLLRVYPNTNSHKSLKPDV